MERTITRCYPCTPEADRAFLERCNELGVTRPEMLRRFIDAWSRYGETRFVVLPPDVYETMAEIVAEHLRTLGIETDSDEVAARDTRPAEAVAPPPNGAEHRARLLRTAATVAVAGAGG